MILANAFNWIELEALTNVNELPVVVFFSSNSYSMAPGNTCVKIKPSVEMVKQFSIVLANLTDEVCALDCADILIANKIHSAVKAVLM